MENLWQKLICNTRMGAYVGPGSEDSLRSPFLVDVDRVIYSSHFRKLQDKTQVHPLSKSDYVRTRLTHSLEVAGVGRSLGYNIGLQLVKKYNLTNVTEHDFGYIMQAACLAHDIGNPPFGHLGEEAIQAFFIQKKDELLNNISSEEYNNLISFDGNSQGFRILTNLAGWKNEGGLRLTYTTLGTFLKYPRAFAENKFIEEAKAQYNGEKIIGTSKIGIFKTELPIFKTIMESLGLKSLESSNNLYFRHPLAFLTEAADDICYSVADVEDAYFVGIADLKDVENLLAPIARSPHKYEGDAKARTSELKKEKFYKNLEDRKKIEWLRGKAINNLILEVQRIFLENETQIYSGEFNTELLKSSIYKDGISACKDYARGYIFNSHEKINSEIKGIEAINGVLEELYRMLTNPSHPKSRRIANLLKEKISPNDSFYEQLVEMVDVVADFTDRNILEFHSILRGY